MMRSKAKMAIAATRSNSSARNSSGVALSQKNNNAINDSQMGTSNDDQMTTGDGSRKHMEKRLKGMS